MQKEAGKLQTVGVLDIQGSVIEHINMLNKIDGVKTVKVKYASQLDEIDKLIIPGGESTAICKLLHNFGFVEKIQEKAKSGMPIWGTCAGMILLAKKLTQGKPCLSIMDIEVIRNAYGSQLSSFTTEELIEKLSPKPVKLVFIRAPYITNVFADTEVLLKVNNNIVMARQGNLLASSFHPELTTDPTIHKYFINM